VFRPFPKKELITVTKEANLLAVIDRNISLGLGGATFADVSSAYINAADRPLILNTILGLGGRDPTVENFCEIVDRSKEVMKTGKVERPVEWINVRKEDVT
jgi:pyruvate ferredoxin oxidoreductase alpha subunit